MPLWLRLSSSAISGYSFCNDCWRRDRLVGFVPVAIDDFVGIDQHVALSAEADRVQAQRAHVGPAPQRIAGAIVCHGMERAPEAEVLLLVDHLAVHMPAPAGEGQE